LQKNRKASRKAALQWERLLFTSAGDPQQIHWNRLRWTKVAFI